MQRQRLDYAINTTHFFARGEGTQNNCGSVCCQKPISSRAQRAAFPFTISLYILHSSVHTLAAFPGLSNPVHSPRL